MGASGIRCTPLASLSVVEENYVDVDVDEENFFLGDDDKAVVDGVTR